MLSSFWQVASVIVLATFGSAVAFSERLSDQSRQRCLASSARDLLGRESVAKDYFRAQRDFERNAFDSGVNDNDGRRIRELDSRRFDTRTDRLSRVYEDRIISAERGLTKERMRFNEVDNEQSRARSQRDRPERRIDSHVSRSVQRRERQEERKNLSNLRRDFRSTLKTVSGRNDDRQYRLSLERDSKRIDSSVGVVRARFTLKESSQTIRDLVGSFNTRREMTRLFAGRRQADDRRQNRGIAGKQERNQERDVQDREEGERRVLTRDITERRLRQERSEDNFRRSETRSFNSNGRFDINRNILDARVPLDLNRNNNRRNQRDSREVRDMNREEIRNQDREIRRENVRIEDTKRYGNTVNERRQTRDTVELHGRRNDRLNERDEHRFQIRNVFLEREIEPKVHDKAAKNEIRNTRLERVTERRIQDARTERNVQDTRAERRLEREDERRVRDISAERENERRVQEARENAKLERRVRDYSAERRQTDRNERLERRVQEVRAERRDVRNSRLERKDKRQVRDAIDERRESRSMRLERKTERKEQETRVEMRDSRNARVDRESERRNQEARAVRQVTLNAGFGRENERKVRDSRDTHLEPENTPLEREDERRVQETRVERRDVRNARRENERRISDDEFRVERRESRNMRLEREDERKARDSSEERRQDRRIESLDTNARVDDIIRSFNRQFEIRRKLQLSSYSPQVDSFKNTANLNVQMLQALLIGMLLLKVVTQQDMFTKKMNFMANSCKNVVSVGVRKLF